MIAVDRYNALYTESAYGQTINDKKRRMIPAGELRLAAAMRVLERPPMAKGIHIGAPARHDRISQRTPVRPCNAPLPSTLQKIGQFPTLHFNAPAWKATSGRRNSYVSSSL